MISAGQYAPQQQQAMSPYGSPYGQQAYPYQQMGPMFTPVMPQWQTFPMNTGPAMTIKGSLDSGDMGKYLDKWGWMAPAQNALNAIGNGLSQVLQYNLAGQAMSNQLEAITGERGYYATQAKIADDQREVALKQLELQMNAVGTQQTMHHEQVMHEETMLRLQGSIQARLAMIEEGGKTDRARIISMSDAFNRRGYDNGVPFLS